MILNTFCEICVSALVECKLTLYSQGSPVGGVSAQDVVDGDSGAGVRRIQAGQSWRGISQQHTGAHGHGFRDGGEVISSLR